MSDRFLRQLSREDSLRASGVSFDDGAADWDAIPTLSRTGLNETLSRWRSKPAGDSRVSSAAAASSWRRTSASAGGGGHSRRDDDAAFDDDSPGAGRLEHSRLSARTEEEIAEELQIPKAWMDGYLTEDLLEDDGDAAAVVVVDASPGRPRPRSASRSSSRSRSRSRSRPRSRGGDHVAFVDQEAGYLRPTKASKARAMENQLKRIQHSVERGSQWQRELEQFRIAEQKRADQLSRTVQSQKLRIAAQNTMIKSLRNELKAQTTAVDHLKHELLARSRSVNSLKATLQRADDAHYAYESAEQELQELRQREQMVERRFHLYEEKIRCLEDDNRMLRDQLVDAETSRSVRASRVSRSPGPRRRLTESLLAGSDAPSPAPAARRHRTSNMSLHEEPTPPVRDTSRRVDPAADSDSDSDLEPDAVILRRMLARMRA